MQKMLRLRPSPIGADTEKIDLTMFESQEANEMILSTKDQDYVLKGKRKSDSQWEQIASESGVSGYIRAAYDVSNYSDIDIQSATSKKVSVIIRGDIIAGVAGGDNAPKVNEVSAIDNRIDALEDIRLVYKLEHVVGAGGLAPGSDIMVSIKENRSMVYKNGLLMVQGSDYTIGVLNVTITNSAEQGDVFLFLNWEGE